MKYFSIALLGAMVLTGCSSTKLNKVERADKLLVSYVAELSYKDHFSQGGQRLQSVGAIIKRDRENYHKYKKRDSLDEWGKFLHDSKDRDNLERMVNDGQISDRDRHIILNNYPLVRVNIYNAGDGGDIARVYIIDDNANKSTVKNVSSQYNNSCNCNRQ